MHTCDIEEPRLRRAFRHEAPVVNDAGHREEPDRV